MADYSLNLNEDQVQLKEWVHGFAEDVMRPAGEEWDEREETPWPIIEEAAKIGLYGWEIMAETMMNDPTGISPMVLLEERSGATRESPWRSWVPDSLLPELLPRAHPNR